MRNCVIFAMMKKWNIIGWLCMIFCLCACNHTTKISGVIHQSKQQYAMLYAMLPQGMEYVDTVLMVNGKFSYVCNIEEATVYVLRFSDTCFASFVLLPGEKVNIEAQADNINRTLHIQGNEETLLLNESRARLTLLDDKVKVLSEEFKQCHTPEEMDSVNQCLMLQYDTLYQEHKQWLKRFILAHPQRLASLMAFYQTLGCNSFFTAQQDAYLLDTLYHHLIISYPQSVYVEDLAEKLGYDD